MPDRDDWVIVGRTLRDTIGSLAPHLIGPLITGMEVTQAIQHYRSWEHLRDPADQGADNSVVLVAKKPAVVRVYVRPGAGVAVGDPLTGTLVVQRRKFLGSYQTVGTYSPAWDSTITPEADSYDDERGFRWNSLNFRIPAEAVAGDMRLTFTLSTGQTRTVAVTARLIQTLRIRVIPIRYQGPSTATPTPGTPPTQLDLPAPTVADAQSTAALAFRAMPVQQTGSFASAGTMDWSMALDDARMATGCTPNWDLLLSQISLMRINDGNRQDVVYYGLLPAETPIGPVAGCGRASEAVGRSGDTSTFLHEIGHGYGSPHAPAGNAPNADPDYPVYEPYPSGSIGEYGFDVQNGTVYSPTLSSDYMSYGPIPWTSLYRHHRLLQHPRLDPVWLEENPYVNIPAPFDPKNLWWPNPPWRKPIIRDRRPVIFVRGVVDIRGVVHVHSIARLMADPQLDGLATDWSVQLMSESGVVASRAHLIRVDSHGDGCECGPEAHEGNVHLLPFEFHAMLPDVEPGSALQIIDPQGNDSWERIAPDRPPAFEAAHARVARNVLQLGWALGSEVNDVWAQWSQDGALWHGLAVGLTDGAKLPLTGLPPGRVQVRLLAHDGFSTAHSEAMEIDVPEQAPEVAIVYPSDSQTVLAGTVMEVVGSAVGQAGDPIEDGLLEWALDGERIGSGRVASLTLEPGEHELSLTARASHDGTATVRIRALTVDDD